MARFDKRTARKRRHARKRRRICGTNERPRLCVSRSNRHIYAQVISDESGRTLVAASTLKLTVEGEGSNAGKAASRQVGQLIGKLCQDSSIRRVVFDCGGYRYHGRVKEVADGARAAGLEF